MGRFGELVEPRSRHSTRSHPMADNRSELYSEELEPGGDEYHIVEGGNLYLINFEKNHAELRPEHKLIIKQKVVPFICRAVRKLGPRAYWLHVFGSASATGSYEKNMGLAGNRAYNSAMEAIHQFEELQKTDKTLAGV